MLSQGSIKPLSEELRTDGKTHLLSLVYKASALTFSNSFLLGSYMFSKLYTSLSFIKYFNICHPD